MATVIDALLVTLGLDAAGFKKGAEETTKAQAKLADQSKKSVKEIREQEKKLADEQKARAKELEARSKAVAMGLNKVRNEALSMLAIFTAGKGLKEFVFDTINSAASLGMQAANLRMSTEELSAYQRASERAGGTASGMTAQLKESASEIARLKTGMGPSDSMQWFFRMGGSSDSLKDGNTYLLARAKIINELYKQDPTKAALIASQMGISEDQFNLIKQGPEAILALVDAQKKNSAITEKNAEEALKLKNRMLDLRDRLEMVGTKILLHLAPQLEKLMVWFQGLADWVANHQDDISRWIDAAAKAVVVFAKTMNDAAQSVGGWKVVLEALIALKVISFASNMLTLASSIIKVGDALGGLAKFSGILARLGPLFLLLYSKGLNSGEDDLIKKMNAGKPGYDAEGNSLTNNLTPTGAAKDGTPGYITRSGKLRMTGSSTPRGMRNNNPGNIRYGKFAVDHGATGQDPDGFAIFPDMATGQAAMNALLGGYLSSGNNTIRKSISKWAPSSENDTAAYITAVSKQMGIDPGAALTRANIPGLAAAISRHENGAQYALAASNFPTGVGALSVRGGNSQTSNSDVKINQITVQTSATDAVGIAKSIGSAVQNHSFVSQANTGLD